VRLNQEARTAVPTISTNDLKNGMTIVYRGKLYQVVFFQHIKPGKGHAFVRTKLKDIQTGQVIEPTFPSKERIEQAYIEKRAMEYLYRDGDHYVLMDPESFEQIHVSREAFGGKEKFIKENTQLLVSFHDNTVVEVQVPDSVVLKVVETPPGVRGDTVSGATKPATLETGVVVQVPLFVEPGSSVRVDTRSGLYLERA